MYHGNVSFRGRLLSSAFLLWHLTFIGSYAKLLPIIDDPVIILASSTASSTPSNSPTASKTSTATSTHTWRPSASPSVTPTVSSQLSSPLSYSTFRSYYNAYKACNEQTPSSIVPERLGIGNSLIYIPDNDGIITPGTISVTRNGISWSISSDTNPSLSLIDSCTRDSEFNYNTSVCFCPSVLREIKPGTWQIYGASTKSGSTCMLIQRDYTIKTNAESSVKDNSQIRLAYSTRNPSICPDTTLFVQGSAVLNENDYVIVYVKELITSIPNDNDQPLPSVLLFSSILLILSGIIQ